MTFRQLGLVALAVHLCACERGCLSGQITSLVEASAPMPIDEIDCPDGLARCVEGRIETSRAARIRSGSCPWDRVAFCATGCVAEGVDAVMTRERASVQLCAASGMELASRPPSGEPASVHCEERFRCEATTVYACAAGRGEAAAVCTRGCVESGAALDDPEITLAAATAILCTR